MKRIVPFILLFVALLLHGNVIHAQKLSLLPLNTSNTQLTNEGVTTVESLSNERIQVTTHGLRVRGTISCNSDAECIAAGLDGTEISTRLDWKLNLDAKTSDLVGIMGLDQHVIITKPVDQSSPLVFSLGGSGTLAFFDVTFGPE